MTRRTWRRLRHVRERRRGRDLERGLAGPRRLGVEDDHERRLGHADLGLEQRLRLRGLEVVPDEPAGAQGAGRLEGERHGRENQHGPGDDDRPAVPRRPSPDPLESGHRRRPRRTARAIGDGSVVIGSIHASRLVASARRDDLHALVRELPEQPPRPVHLGRRRRALRGHHPAAAMSSDGRSRWTKKITGPNGKWFWGMLFFGWAVVFGVGAAARPAHRRELALRRHRADRPVLGLLHLDGLHLERDRGVAPRRTPSAALARDPGLLGRPLPRPLQRRDLRVARRRVRGRAGARRAARPRTRCRAAGRIHSPCGRWNSTDVSSGQTVRCIPKYGRSSVVPAGPSASRSGLVRMTSGAFVRNISQPPGRSRRAASGIQAYGSAHSAAPYSLIAPSKLPDSNGVVLGVAEVEREVDPELLLERRARSRAARASCRCPTGRAPRFASHADTYAGPAAELDDVLAGDVVGQQVDVRLGDAPDAPRDLVRRPAPPARLDVLVGVAIPGLAIRADVLGQVVRFGVGACGRHRHASMVRVAKSCESRRATALRYRDPAPVADPSDSSSAHAKEDLCATVDSRPPSPSCWPSEAARSPRAIVAQTGCDPFDTPPIVDPAIPTGRGRARLRARLAGGHGRGVGPVPRSRSTRRATASSAASPRRSPSGRDIRYAVVGTEARLADLAGGPGRHRRPAWIRNAADAAVDAARRERAGDPVGRRERPRRRGERRRRLAPWPSTTSPRAATASSTRSSTTRSS